MFAPPPATCIPPAPPPRHPPQVSWVVPELVMLSLHSGLLVAAMAAFGFPLVTRNSAALVFLLLWCR